MKPEEIFVFRLYVTGDQRNSREAIYNLKQICEANLAGRYDIEIVDLLLEPKRALAESIFLTPTLVSVSPFPGRRIVGTLSNTEPVLQILGLGPAKRRKFPGLKDRDAGAQQLRSS